MKRKSALTAILRSMGVEASVFMCSQHS